MNPVTARVPFPHLIVRGQDTEIACPLYRDGALVLAVDGTVEVRGPGGVVATGAVVVAGGVATYEVDADDTAGLSLGDVGWLVTWTLTATGYVEPIVVRSTAALVRTSLRPVVAAVDLYLRAPALDPAARGSITRDDAGTRHQWAIDEAWNEIEGRLLENGRRPWLVLAPGALRRAHLNLALSYAYDDLAARVANPDLAVSADRYRAAYDAAWDALSLTYDADRDGKADEDQVAGSATVWLL